jgi:aspartate 1-decarboxylase
MRRQFCKSKITHAVVTKSLVHYEGSCGIDAAILEAAEIRPYEWIVVANVTTGARLETYAIAEPAGSGAIHVYGAAAHEAAVGHVLILMSFCWLEESEVAGFQGTRVVKLESGNRLAADPAARLRGQRATK